MFRKEKLGMGSVWVKANGSSLTARSVLSKCDLPNNQGFANVSYIQQKGQRKGPSEKLKELYLHVMNQRFFRIYLNEFGNTRKWLVGCHFSIKKCKAKWRA